MSRRLVPFGLSVSSFILLCTLTLGCSGQNEQPKEPPQPNLAKGEMPKRDPAREAEFAAERAKRVKALEPVERKVVAGLPTWKNFQEGEQGEVAVLELRDDKRSVSHPIISPDGTKLVLPWFEDGKRHCQIVDFASGKEISHLPAMKDAQIKYSFSPDSTLLAAGGFDRQITIWDASNGKNKKTIPMNGRVWSLAFAPDGKHILASVEGAIGLFHIDSGKAVTSIGTPTLNAGYPAISPRGNLIVSIFSGENNKVGFWEKETGAPIKTLDKGKGRVKELALSPDGWSVALSVSDADLLKEKLLLYSLDKDKETTIAQDSNLRDLAFSPDGKYLAFRAVVPSFDHELVLFDLAAEKEIRRIPRVPALQVMFSPGGSMLAAMVPRRLRIWRVTDVLTPPDKKEK
jgi:WD40 repeat protein